MIITSNFTAKKPIDHRFNTTTLQRQLMLWIVIVLTQFICITVSAAENPEHLTLSEAIHRTFNSHPQLRSFQYRLDAQQGRVIQANLSPKPLVELTVEDAFGSGDVSGINSAQTTLSVSWILDHRIKAKRAAVAVQGKSLIESDKAIKQLDIASQTARYFVTALAIQENTVIANRAIALAKSTVDEVKKRVDAGKTPLAELYLAEAEVAKRKLRLFDLKHQLHASLRQLGAQWGSTTPTFNAVSGSLGVQPAVIGFHALKSQIIHNPSLAKYLSQSRVNKARLKLAQEERNPKWTFSTGIKRFERTDDFGLVAGISIPFGGSNNNQGRIAEVRAGIAQNQSEADALQIRIETSLYIVYQRLQHSIHLGEMLKKEIIPRLEQALTQTHKAYELGKYSYLEWLTVQNELLDTQSALLEANLAAHLNKIELEKLTGTQITSPF